MCTKVIQGAWSMGESNCAHGGMLMCIDDANLVLEWSAVLYCTFASSLFR